jgi:beta-glucanase (GH16 family)
MMKRALIILVLCALAAALLWSKIGDAQTDAPNIAPLDISQYTLTFSDDFTLLSASGACPKGPVTWYWQKPDRQNFGNIGFNTFSVADGVLTIAIKKMSGKWQAGLLSSLDCKGNGFSQRYGYFEAKMQLSAAAGGNWPAFWLLAACHIPFPGSCDDVEIDVVEQYGNYKPQQLNMTYHHWTSPTAVDVSHAAIANDMTAGYHLYGVDIEDNYITWYYDRRPMARMATPPEAKTPMYVLVDHACSGDPPCGDPKTQSPTNLLVDYIHVYQRK